MTDDLELTEGESSARHEQPPPHRRRRATGPRSHLRRAQAPLAPPPAAERRHPPSRSTGTTSASWPRSASTVYNSPSRRPGAAGRTVPDVPERSSRRSPRRSGVAAALAARRCSPCAPSDRAPRSAPMVAPPAGEFDRLRRRLSLARGTAGQRRRAVELLVSTAVRQPDQDRLGRGAHQTFPDAGDLLLEAERVACSSPFDSVDRSRCTASSRRCCWRNRATFARCDCAAAPPAPDRWRASATAWRRSTWLDAGEAAEALRVLAGLSMSGFDVAGADAMRPVLARSRRGPGDLPPHVVQFASCLLLVDRAGFLDALAGSTGRRTGAPNGRTARASCIDVCLARRRLAGVHRPCPRRARAPRRRSAGRRRRAFRSEAGDPRGGAGRAVGCQRPARRSQSGRGARGVHGLPHESARALGLALAGAPARLPSRCRRCTAPRGAHPDANRADRAPGRGGDRGAGAR